MRKAFPFLVIRHPSSALTPAYPLALMVGILLYFQPVGVPLVWIGPVCAGVAAVALAAGWRTKARFTLLLIFLVALGYGAAQFRVGQVVTPLIGEEMRNVTVQGRIDEVIPDEEGQKLVLSELSIPEAKPLPERLRVSLRKPADVAPGDLVKLRATLYPLPRPLLPGAFDIGRYYYFNRIGATGFAFGTPQVVEKGEAGSDHWLERFRTRTAQDMIARLGPVEGAVAAALTVGEQNAVPETTNEVMRASGLYHILSISGVHLAIAAGILFFCVRLVITLIPPLALRVSAKKIAAGAALAGALFYLLAAGSPIPAQRSFIMVAFALVAILFDRKGISLHALSWAAVFILLLYPESLLGASFQMSFAATLAIVALYERFGVVLYRPYLPFHQQALLILAAGALVSLVATVATAPFVITYFNRFQMWGVVANLLVEPLNLMFIMPGVVLSFLLMPFSLEGFGYVVLELGIKGMLWVAARVAALPYASIPVPPLTEWGLLLAVGGFLLITLAGGRAAKLGAVGMAAGVASMLLFTPPDLIVGEGARQVMVRRGDEFELMKGTGRAFAVKAWLKHVQREAAARAPCEKSHCVVEEEGRRIVLVNDWKRLAEFCKEASDVLVVWRYVKPEECPGAKLLIERNALEIYGAHTLVWHNGAPRVKTAVTPLAEGQAPRPWVVSLTRLRAAKETQEETDE